MSNRSLAETLVFVNLLFVSSLSVRACSGVHVRVRGCFGTVLVVFGYRSGYVRALFGSRLLGRFLRIQQKTEQDQLHGCCICHK